MSNLLNTAQTTGSTNSSEQNKEQRVNNIVTRMGKKQEQQAIEYKKECSQISYAMDVDQKNMKYKNITRITYL